MKMFDGIFWDNDGVLMETEHLYYQANAEALAQVGVELTLEDFCRISLRRGESVLDLAAGEGQSGSDAAELRQVRNDIYYREVMGSGLTFGHLPIYFPHGT
jgi:beta-phosphoglucomutase-like phosphatase (HAD superfamily)